MDIDPIVAQCALTIPISLGLAVYSLVRLDRSALHALLAALLVSASLWLSGMMMKLVGGSEAIRLAGLDLESGAVIFMPPLFVMMMGYFARSPFFEESLAPSISLLTAGALFLAGYLTDDLHHLFFHDRAAAVANAPPAAFAGPLYWSVQLWCAICNLGAFAYGVQAIRRGRTRDERGRAVMVFAAVLVPIVAHLVYVLDWLPIDYTLAPGALALTALFFVQGVHRYGLLGSRSIVRHDLIEHLEEGLLLADPDGTVIDANSTAEQILGLPRQALRGRLIDEALELLAPEEECEPIGKSIIALPLDNGRVGAELRTRTGRCFEVLGGAVPELGTQPAGRFVTLIDRTDDRRRERLLRERQKLESVGILAAGVAHEVNNPLAYVRANLVHLRGLTDDLAKKLDPSAGEELSEMPEVLEESIEGLDRIARIVESMLRFSRVSDDASGPVDVSEVVEEALRLAALRRDGGISVEWTPPAALHRVRGSAPRLVQVLLNLLLNARQALAGREDGRITAQVGLEDDHVLIRVRDNGPGIPEDVQPLIFDPFFTTRAPDEGTGLGLSIAFDIVREHGGTLELETHVTDGSSFAIRLPAPNDGGVPADTPPAARA